MLKDLRLREQKNKQRTVQRIHLKLLAANLRQAIYATPEINGINGYQNPHLWGDLNHGALRKNS